MKQTHEELPPHDVPILFQLAGKNGFISGQFKKSMRNEEISLFTPDSTGEYVEMYEPKQVAYWVTKEDWDKAMLSIS